MSRYYTFHHDGNEVTFDGVTFELYHGSGSDLIPLESQSFGPISSVPSTLALTLTNNCNMGCSYCYANQGNWNLPGKNMSFETASKSVDLLFDSIQRGGKDFGTIAFFGGEPLLSFNLIKAIVAYSENNRPTGIAIRYAVVTNGTLFSPDITNYLIEKQFIVSLSIDGPKYIHDNVRVLRNGKGTYDNIVAKVQKLILQTPVLARPTISDHNPNVCEVVTHIASLGFKRITFEVDQNIGPAYRERFFHSFDKLWGKYVEAIRAGQYYDLKNLTRIITSILTHRKVRSHCNCNSGYLCVSADGQVYPCHRFIGAQDLSLGTVHHIDIADITSKIRRFNSHLTDGARSRSTSCLDCPFAYLCGGTCYHNAYTQTGNLFAIPSTDCSFKKYFFDRSLRLIYELRGDQLRKFLNFLVEVWNEEDRTGCHS